MKRYDKLVRDGIPQIIEASGKNYAVRTLDEGQYRAALIAKMAEETAEYQADRSAEELADMLEVLLALAELEGVAPEELERIRAEKARDRGGFHDRILLEWTD